MTKTTEAKQSESDIREITLIIAAEIAVELEMPVSRLGFNEDFTKTLLERLRSQSPEGSRGN